MPGTLNKILKIVSIAKFEPEIQRFCKSCNAKINAESLSCSNENCLDNSKVSKSFNTFKCFNIEKPLKDLVNCFFHKIVGCDEETRDFKDILDGSHYASIQKQDHLNLMVYTDGIQISKSSKNNFWPVICGLVELPIQIRDSIKNKIIFGVWQGNSKPTSDILFENLKKTIQKINENGILIEQNRIIKLFYFQIYVILCDTPAKALVLNMNQFNGKFVCPYCFNPGI